MEKFFFPLPAPNFVLRSFQVCGVMAAFNSQRRELRDSVTVVITTSPASDHPRTELLEQVLESFRFVEGLARCKTVIVCDGYKIANSCNFRGGRNYEKSVP
jgi:hypothetical protein